MPRKGRTVDEIQTADNLQSLHIELHIELKKKI